MHPPSIEDIDHHVKLLGSIIAGLLLLIPRVRDLAAIPLRWIGRRMGAGKLDEILEISKSNADKIALIESQMLFNGGNSLRDMLVVVVNRQQQQFWRSLRPSVEIDGDAMVTLVSESACQLFGVLDPQALRMRNWLRFVDGGRVDDFLHAYVETVSRGSSFSFEFELKRESGDPIGRWELRLNPVTLPGMSRQVYSGYFRPVDDRAKGCDSVAA